MDFDFIIIGSGFGGSVAAHRLTEKGKSVFVLEKGLRLTATDFPSTNWELKKWLWAPALGFKGLFQMSFFRHITIFSGVGVGGGSLVYANTLPKPKSAFFNSPSWKHLSYDWEKELMPHYSTALHTLGATQNPNLYRGDEALHAAGKEINPNCTFEPTQVAVFFGEAGKTVPDPYFNGKGPDRAGCKHCGSCMLGCPHNAKNTLDKNYLYFAQQNGAIVSPQSQVINVEPISNGKNGYKVTWKNTFGKEIKTATCKGIIFSAGVLGTLPLLLKLKQTSLPKLSDTLGYGIRTNNESLLATVSFEKDIDLSQGIAISSIVHPDDNTHVEVVRYNAGSGFFRLGISPAVMGKNVGHRAINMLKDYIKDPVRNLKGFTVDDLAKRSQVLLFMQTIDSTLRFRLNKRGQMVSDLDQGKAPTPFIPEAHDFAHRFAKHINGKAFALISETLMGVPSTAHILGGACMGEHEKTGVIDCQNRVFGYDNMYVCDGSMITANPGVNPSLTITALSERAMQFI